MAGPGNIVIKVGAETAGAVRELGHLENSLGSTMTKGQRATAALGKAALPAAAALGAIAVAGVDATKAAMEDAAAQDLLAGTLKRVSGATNDQIKAAEDYISKLSQQTGVADDDLRPALGKLATATGDVTKAQEALGLAVDISAQTGKDLNTVSDALAKAYAGNTTSLGRLVPGIDKATLASKDMAKITAELSDLTGGAAVQAGKTAAGQYKILQTQLGETKEAIGAGLIPVVQALLPLLIRAGTFAQDNADAIRILAGVVAVLAGGILAANAAIKAYEALQLAVKAATAAWTAAQWLLNAALTANPIGVVVVAIAALAAGLVVAYNKSETFRNIVQGAMRTVEGAVDSLKQAFNQLREAAFQAFDWLRDHWTVGLFAFGPIGAAIYVLAENFDKVKAAASAAWGAVKDFSAAPLAGITAAADAIAGAFRRVESAINAAISAVRNLIDWLSRIHVPKIKLPHIPGINAAGYPSSTAGAYGRAAAAGATTGGGGITINVYGAVDPEGTARTIRRILRSSDLRTGRIIA